MTKPTRPLDVPLKGYGAAATDTSDQVSDHRVIWLLYELYHIAFCLPFTSISAHCVGCYVLSTPSPLFNYRPTICECHSLNSSNDHFPVDFEMRVISPTRLSWRLTQVMCHVEEAVNYGLFNITRIRLEKFEPNIGTKNSIRSAGISRAPLSTSFRDT